MWHETITSNKNVYCKPLTLAIASLLIKIQIWRDFLAICVFYTFSAIRRGQSFKNLFFKETRIKESELKETDSFCRNVFHYAVSKPDTLKQLLENAKTVS